MLQPRKKVCCNSPENQGLLQQSKNKTGQLKKGCPVFGFHIINLHKTDIKQVRKAGCPSKKSKLPALDLFSMYL